MKRLFLIIALLSFACASDTRRIADAVTAHTYLLGAYQLRCVAIPHHAGPELDACFAEEAALVTLKLEAQLSDAAATKGKGHLPALARKRLRAAKTAAEKAAP